MEKLIFFGLAIPILAYVLYLGGTAIMKGFSAKEANRVEKEETESQTNLESTGQSIKKKFQFSLPWEKNQLAIWDNRSMLHQATPFKGNRIMHRITIK